MLHTLFTYTADKTISTSIKKQSENRHKSGRCAHIQNDACKSNI